MRVAKKKTISLKGAKVERRDFTDFPFDDLLAEPHDCDTVAVQYDAVWHGLILDIYADMVAECRTPEDKKNIYFKKIDKYVCTFEQTLIGLLDYHADAIRSVAPMLFDYIAGFFHSVKKDAPGFVIRFDKLDKRYVEFCNRKEYYTALASLFRAATEINDEFEEQGIDNARVMVCLRKDLYDDVARGEYGSWHWDSCWLKKD